MTGFWIAEMPRDVGNMNIFHKWLMRMWLRCPVRLSGERCSADSRTDSLSDLASAPYREMISSPA